MTQAAHQAFKNNHPNTKILGHSRENRWADEHAIAAVGPEGQWCVCFFPKAIVAMGEEFSQGETPVIYTAAGGVGIAVWAKARGWVLYEDLCKGKVINVDASAKHWALWQKLMKMFAAGRVPARGALEKLVAQKKLGGVYHPEVARRREKAAKGGAMSLDVDELKSWLGFDEAVEVEDFDIDTES